MNKKFLGAVALLSLFLVLLAVSALAQTARQLTMTIPFAFVVGKTTLPAGTYNVYRTSTNTADWFSICNADRSLEVVFNTHTIEAEALSTAGRLEFRRAGNQYFLAQVWTEGNKIGHELSQSSLERELAKETELQSDKTEVVPLSGQ